MNRNADMLLASRFIFHVAFVTLQILQATDTKYCSLDISHLTANVKTWAKINDNCCGYEVIYRMSKRSEFHCFEACFTMVTCKSLYYDENDNDCILFKTDDLLGMVYNGYFLGEQPPNSASYLMQFSKSEFRKLVSR